MIFRCSILFLKPLKSRRFKSLINPYCFGQALSNMRAITFVVTHDIPNNEVFLEHVMDEVDERLAHAFHSLVEMAVYRLFTVS